MWSIIFFSLAVTVALSDHVPDHADTTLDVDYETVTKIINALKSSKEDAAEQFTTASPEEETKIPDSAEESPDSVFQKRKQVYVAQFHRKPSQEVVLQERDQHTEEDDKPCDDEVLEGHIEIIEDENPGFVGSLRGTPGVDYPDYTEIPLTSFTCADKQKIPGFYADVETNCQVFHVCYPHRRESFLCPIGTIFNQPILACDYWYSSNCSAAPEYFDVEEDLEPETVEEIVEDLISTVEVEPTEQPEEVTEAPETFTIVVEPSEHTFGPNIPEPVEPKPVPLEIHEVKPVVKKPLAPQPVRVQTPDIVSIAKFLPVKAKVVALKATKVAAVKPVKIAAVKAAKAKIVAAKAVPVAKVVKAAAAKAVLGKKLAVPIVKTLAVKKAVKVGKATLAKAKAAKLVSLKAYPAISALTKKQLALSLIKMMKAQKMSHLGSGVYMY